MRSQKYKNIKIEEINDSGEIIKTYDDPYGVADIITKEGLGKRGQIASRLIESIKLKHRFRGKLYRFAYIGDSEVTSNNVKDS